MRLTDGTTYQVTELCGLVDCKGAETEAVYTGDWYAGQPCLTRHAYGAGEAWYLAAQVEQAVDRGGVIFLQNYAGEARRVTLLRPYEELISGKTLSGETELPVCAVLVLRPLE